MPTNWIVRPHHELIEEYALFFERIDSPGSGFGPSCDVAGNIIGDLWRTKEEREADVAGFRADPALRAPVLQNLSRTWFNAGSVRCGCGAEHQLVRGDSACDCGQLFNACGQELVPRDQWEENYEEDY